MFNEDGNDQITYSTFTGSSYSNTTVNSPALVHLDDSGTPLTPNTATTLGTDCQAEGGFTNGLQARSASAVTNSPITAGRKNADIFLAQNVPNPCSGSTSISYRTPLNGNSVQVVVRDYFSGKPMLRQQVASGEHTVELRLANLQPGIYHYTLEIEGLPVAHHNLLIQ